MKTALWDLQVSILKRLKSHAQLMDQVSGVYDSTTAKAFPYISFGEETSTSWHTKSNDGEEITTTIHIWSRYNGDKEVKQIISYTLDSLTKEPLSLEGGFFMEFSDLDMMEILSDPDGQTRHGVLRLRFKILQ